jgi:hypothetical protein
MPARDDGAVLDGPPTREAQAVPAGAPARVPRRGVSLAKGR